APSSYLAGDAIWYCAQVTDDYYNVWIGSAVTISVTDSDANNAGQPNGSDVVTPSNGHTTFRRAFVTANTAPGQTVTATGAGIFPNPSNPSTPIVINGRPAQTLIAVLPGETQVPGKAFVAPFGKTGVPLDTQAGSTYTATVYAVDSF